MSVLSFFSIKRTVSSLATVTGVVGTTGAMLIVSLANAPKAVAQTVGADTIVIVDQSGSMGGEISWLGGAITSLEARLNVAGFNSNRYGLIRYGGYDSIKPATVNVGGGLFGSATQFGAAVGGLAANGWFEDGYAAIDTALNTGGYKFRPNAVSNIILVTDEDRDITNGSTFTYKSILGNLNTQNALLNVVVSAGFADGSGRRALGIDSKGNAYIADGKGGFTANPGTKFTSGFGTTKSDYVDLALATGGTAWDLNLLRAGGLTATSFTNSFVDIKVRGVQQQPTNDIPTPAMLPGLIGMGTAAWRKRRKTATAEA